MYRFFTTLGVTGVRSLAAAFKLYIVHRFTTYATLLCIIVIALVDLFVSLLNAEVLQETVYICDKFKGIALKSNIASWDCKNTTITIRFVLFFAMQTSIVHFKVSLKSLRLLTSFPSLA